MPTADFIVVTLSRSHEARQRSVHGFKCLRKWKKAGWKFGMIADEVHHSSKSHLKTWSAIGS